MALGLSTRQQNRVRSGIVDSSTAINYDISAI